MNAGLLIFVVFFGISLLDAVVNGQWMRGLIWVGAGLLFAWLGRQRSHEPRPGQPRGR
jgi:hypothetical protein